MKRTLSFLLCVLLLFTAMMPAFARLPEICGSQIPVVILAGDGEALYDADGNYVFQIDDLGSLTEGSDRKELLRSIANVLQPFLLEGLLQNKWDNYYEKLEEEVSELFENVRLDENGEVTNGTDISKARRDYLRDSVTVDAKADKGYYDLYDYHFWYDWRRDPLAIADELAAYVDAVKAITGAPKVAISGRCVGCNVMLAYLAKYGYDSVYGFGFDGTSSNGGEFISEAISGKFKLDGPAVERFLIDYDETGMIDLSDFAVASIDLLVKSGAVEGLSKTVRATIYDKVVYGVTGALARSTFFTMPCYWGFVEPEDYEDAKLYVFGEAGSEKRVQYAGLIEKLDNYHNQVAERIPELMQGLQTHGVKTAIISKYGFQMLPICVSGVDVVSDQYASVTNSSFGATTGTLYGPLSDEYIAQRVAEGKGKYISPDKQVDASTCMFPDYTWFTKGVRHGEWTRTENEILYSVITADTQLTVDDFDLTQFMVWDPETETMSPMTEANCHTEYWTADQKVDHPACMFQRLLPFLRSLKVWLKEAFKALRVRAEERITERKG
ncbi:MAG: hypothetical protein IJL52_01265 [Clostridia bacterium]|nr:hypothetical protein [Clostridia bacterium]